MPDYYELLDYYENNRLKLITETEIPTKSEIYLYLIEVNERYQSLKLAYQPLADMIAEWLECDLSDAFEESDRIIQMHCIKEEDTITMMLAKIMYMMREPSPGSQFLLTDIADFDLSDYCLNDWFDFADLQKCYDEIGKDFAVNLYDYFNDDDIVIDKRNLLSLFKNDDRLFQQSA